MSKNNLILLSNLGMCDCGTVVATPQAPIDTFAHNKNQKCTHCEKILTLANFGYETGTPQRTRWIGPDKKWTNTRPTRDFRLGRWYVIIGSIKTRRNFKS